MFDRYDPRSSSERDRDDFSDRNRGSRGGSGERDHASDRDPRDVFTKDLDLPRTRERRPVRDRDRVYEISGTESRMLATVGAFRVVERAAREGRNPRSGEPMQIGPRKSAAFRAGTQLKRAVESS